MQAPVDFWDPVGFTAGGNAEHFKRRRSAKVKRGRVCIRTTMGCFQSELFGKSPGFLPSSMNLKFAGFPIGLGAPSEVPALGRAQLIGYGACVEIRAGSDGFEIGTPGDYGFKLLTSAVVAGRTRKLFRESANGRLAVLALFGHVFPGRPYRCSTGPLGTVH